MRKERELFDIGQSFKDMVRIYKPIDIEAYARQFAIKYNVKGYEKELIALVKKEDHQ